MIEQLIQASGHILELQNLAFLIMGVTGGILVGCLPGLTATMALALLVPFTFTMPPVTGLVMLGGLYVGAMFGDAIPATLINTPGTPSAIATTFDGFPLTKKGMAQHSLVTAAFSSMVGGIIGALFLLTLSPPLANLALKFGPPEYFWIAIFGLTIIGTLAADSLLKGLAGGAFGLLLSTVGISPIAGDIRFTFGLTSLQAGLDLIVILIGFFCIPQILEMAGERHRHMHVAEYRPRPGVFAQVVKELVGKPILLIRSSLIGTFIGILPGAGGNIGGLISYNEAKRWAKEPEAYGKGTIEGVAASEAANNAVVPGALVPLLTLGIPGAPPAAVIFGALLLHGMRPGPELYTQFGEITYTFILSFIAGAVIMFVIGSIGSQFFARMINVPVNLLIPFVTFLSVIGAFAIRNNMTDVGIMLLFGFVGFATRQLGFHPGPIVLGLILGPYAEQGLVQSLLMAQASGSLFDVMLGRPISLVLIAMSIISLAWPLVTAIRHRRMSTSVRKEEEEWSTPTL